jgi:adenylate cyclase
MGKDEAGTLAAIRSAREDLVEPKVREHDGRIVKLMGDGMLVEFPSVVEAVQCAVEIQQSMASRSTAITEDRQIKFRIGINLGDIIVEGGDIYGDGVNIAARLEGLAEPGGINISRSVHTQILGKVGLHFEDLGEQTLKNIDLPVRVYRIVIDRRTAASLEFATGTGNTLTLPDKPSIAVLPFVNMSGESDQEYFADGITEDIITALSMIRWFFVIASNTSFAYKGRAVSVRDVARALGVGYVLEGSIRKAGNRVRINAQLIDGASGNHVWAKRYDRELEDIFAVQDEITEMIVGATEPEMGRAERERAKTQRPESLRAWGLYQRGMWHTYRRTKDDLAEAQRLFREAIKVAPNLASAYAGSEEAYFFQVFGGYVDSPDDAKDEAVRVARRAVELDDQDAFTHFALGRSHALKCQYESAIAEFETAIDLNPSFAPAYYSLGNSLTILDRPEDAIPHIESAMRLSPHDPYFGQFMLRMSEACFYKRELKEAIEWARRSLRQPNVQWTRWAMLASALAHLGNCDEARQCVDALLGLKPEANVPFVREVWLHNNSESFAYFLDGLRKAGLPQ